MKVNYHALDERAQHVFISLIASAGDAFMKTLPEGQNMSTQVDVQITFNGVECDFMKLVESFTMNLDHMAKKEADRLVREKLQDTVEQELDRFSDTLRDVRQKFRVEFGLPVEDYSW